MIFSNKYNLNAPLFHALTWDSYSRGKANISVTGLLKSPRQRILTERHQDEITVDASENLWTLLGRSVHNVLRESAKRTENLIDAIAEERLFVKVNGPLDEWTLSGEFDLLYKDENDLVLTDYKCLSIWSYILEKNGGVKKEHEQQLNIYRWMLSKYDFHPTKLEISMIFRDWKQGEAEKSVASGRTDYPQAPIMVVPVAMWTLEDTEKFIKERIALHQKADAAGDDYLPNCSDDERWVRGDSWAVMKGTAKRALRVFDNDVEANACAQEIGGKVEFRKGKAQKCSLFCQANRFCSQFQKEVSGANPVTV